MEKLPGEILSEIFVRLLAKQIGQMRSVCKPWNALLSDSSFIKSHLHHSVQKNDEILLCFDLVFSLDRSPFTARLSRSPDLELTNFIRPPVIPQIKNGCGAVIGSVNGLTCFLYQSSDGFVLHIWNPSLSSILSLLPLSVPSCSSHFGFGYDPKSDDYKVLKLTRVSIQPDKVKQGEVYSMRKGSWKSISPQTIPSYIKIPDGQNSQVCVDDHLHWLCVTGSEWKPQTIVAFDLGEDALSEIPLPDSILDSKVYRSLNVLGALGGKLCVMSRVRDGKCEVWVMDEYGVADSWVKHQAFPPFSSDITPYGFTSHGEFLFQVGINDDRFALYDPIAAKTKTFKIKMSREFPQMKFVEYVDSLVWIEPVKREISNCDIS